MEFVDSRVKLRYDTAILIRLVYLNNFMDRVAIGNARLYNMGESTTAEGAIWVVLTYWQYVCFLAPFTLR